MAAARIRRTARAVIVTAALTTTGITRYTFRVTAKAGGRTVGTCVARRTLTGDGRTAATCSLKARARAALRDRALALTLVAIAVPSDPAVPGTTISVQRTQTARRG